MLILIFRIYSATVAVTLLLEMLTTLRSQIHGIPLGDNELERLCNKEDDEED